MAEGVGVIIATRGRAALVRDLLVRLADQTRPPRHVFVIGSMPGDVAGLEDGPGLTVRVGRQGLTLQRNDGLALAGDRFDTVVFFDDDFIPSRSWLQRAVEIFEARPELACLTGRVLADGIHTGGISPEDASSIVAAQDQSDAVDRRIEEGPGPYGCNMAFRYTAIRTLAFDERLPLYGWLEDADFGGQTARHGRTARAHALCGVHLGHKTGRDQGLRLGYSQVANVAHLLRKGTLPAPFLLRTMARNIVANLVRSIRPEPYVDRRGRLRGNLLAMLDVARGRITPERAAEL